MNNFSTQNRKNKFIRGLHMFLFGLMINIGLTVIGLLAFFQFFWLFITKKNNLLLAELNTPFRNWFGHANKFTLAASNYKPFPWSRM